MIEVWRESLNDAPIMRITGGSARSIALDCPKGDWVRPATDRMREAVFSSIGDDVQGAVFLDLFAGAGTYGLEAISRGASAGVFVEQHRAALKAIEQNLQAVLHSAGREEELEGNFKITGADVFQWLARGGAPGLQVDLVFVDPPYREVEARYFGVLEQLTSCFHPQKGAWILLESPVLLENFPKGYAVRKQFGRGREDTRAMLLSWLPNR